MPQPVKLVFARVSIRKIAAGLCMHIKGTQGVKEWITV